MERRSFDLYRDHLIVQYFDTNIDAYIQIDDDYLPVCTLVLTWLEFFRNVINDTDVELHGGKPILIKNQTSDVPYINRTTITYLHEYIKNNIIGYECDIDLSMPDQIEYILLIDHLATKNECKILIADLKKCVELCAKLIDSSYTNIQEYFNDSIRYKAALSLIDSNPNECQRICSYYKILYGLIPSNFQFFSKEPGIAYSKSNHSIYNYAIYKSYFFLLNCLQLPENCKFVESVSCVGFVWSDNVTLSEKIKCKSWTDKYVCGGDACILSTCTKFRNKIRLQKRTIDNNYYFMNGYMILI